MLNFSFLILFYALHNWILWCSHLLIQLGSTVVHSTVPRISMIIGDLLANFCQLQHVNLAMIEIPDDIERSYCTRFCAF